MVEQVNITFRIKNISTLEFSVKNLSEAETLNKDLFQFQILPASFVDNDNKVIGFNTVVDIFIDLEKQKKVCSLITRVTYDIINFSDFINSVDNSLNIPDQFMHTFLSIALSTTRGILAAKTEGTFLRDVYIPILNPAGFKPMEASIEANKIP